MQSDRISEKSTFVVALLAAILAASSFKQELVQLHLNFGFYNANFFELAVIFIIFLSLSTYLYAFAYIESDIRIWSKAYPFVLLVANLFYVLTLLFPIIILVCWLISIAANSVEQVPRDILLSVISAIIAPFYTVISFISSKKIINFKLKKQAMEFVASQDEKIEKFLSLYANGFYPEAVFEAFKIIELSLRRAVEKRGLVTHQLNFSKLLNIVAEEEILELKYLPSIKYLRDMRNRIAHLDLSGISRKDAELARDLVKKILEILEGQDKS